MAPKLKPYIPKSDPKLPDNWKVTIHYLDRPDPDEFEVVGQTFNAQGGYWEFQLTDDTFEIRYLQNIRGVSFSKEYRAVCEAKARAAAAIPPQPKK